VSACIGRGVESFVLIWPSSAGFAGAFIDREAETRGMDLVDRERAKVCALSFGRVVLLTPMLLSALPRIR
jgi:hypothetical protein